MAGARSHGSLSRVTFCHVQKSRDCHNISDGSFSQINSRIYIVFHVYSQNNDSKKLFDVTKIFCMQICCWLEMWTLWRCVSNWRGLHHPNMPKDWLCGWLHGRRSSPLGDGSQGCSPGGSQLCPGTQNRFSLCYEAPRIDVGRAGRASAHLQSALSWAHQDHLQPGAMPGVARRQHSLQPGPGTPASSSGSGQPEEWGKEKKMSLA